MDKVFPHIVSMILGAIIFMAMLMGLTNKEDWSDPHLTLVIVGMLGAIIVGQIWSKADEI